MVNSINNSMNATTSIPAKLNVGILSPPDEQYKPNLYSDSATGKKFRELGGHTGNSTKRHSKMDKAAHLANGHDSYESKLKTPAGIVIFGVGVAATAIFCLANKKFKFWELIKKQVLDISR